MANLFCLTTMQQIKNRMTNGYYILLCNYSKTNDNSNLVYEAIIQVEDNRICRYTLHSETHSATNFDFLITKDNNNDNCLKVREQTEQEIKNVLCEKYLDLKAREDAVFIFKKSFLDAGEYYSNIYRPFLSNKYLSKKNNIRLTNTEAIEDVLFTEGSFSNETEYLSRFNQLELLLEDLSIIFQTIEPTKHNMNCYGHKIRNLIMLACTEFDSMCKNILVANDYQTRKMYKTDDYVKLKVPLKLDQYEVEFMRYPEIEARTPFKTWELDKPTQSLRWYDAYNQIKHDRINNYKQATLENAIESISAIVILLLAQFGENNIFWKDKMSKYFNVTKLPKWDFADLYIPPVHPYKTGKIVLVEKKYNFT